MKARQKIRQSVLLVSFFLFPATFFYFSPYLIIKAAGERVVNGSFIIFSLLFLFSLFLGRAFCGWVCPAGGCQDIIGNLNGKKIVRGNWGKWAIWAPWVLAAGAVSFFNHGYDKIDFTYQTVYGISISDFYSSVIYFFVMAVIALPAFLIGRRSFCHHICWMAPFMIIGRKAGNIFRLPALRLHTDSGRCTECRLCAKHCPMSLPVDKMVQSGNMENPECILCGACADVCPEKAISLRFSGQQLR